MKSGEEEKGDLDEEREDEEGGDKAKQDRKPGLWVFEFILLKLWKIVNLPQENLLVI